MKHKIGGGYCLVLAIAIFPALSFGAQILVPSQYPSIQQAINAASANDEIIVSPGNYMGGINFLGKAILVRSVDPQNWTIIKTTIINGNESSPGATFNTGETNQTILRGLTLTNGRGKTTGTSYYGGGVYCENSSPVIQYCFITGNGSSSMGHPQYGGGVAVLGNSSPILLNCIVTNNFAYLGGGGFYCTSSGSPHIQSCTFSHNSIAYSSSYCFEVDCRNSQVVIENTIIYTLNETYNRKGLMHNRYDLVNYNCISSAYTSGSFVNIESFGGNISQKPCFISSAYSYVAPNTYVFGDYHLYPASPCINKGDPNYAETGLVDIDNQPRIMSGRIDIGADEFQDTIKVLKPAAGEVWAAGSTKAICWESLNYKNPVDIFYSIDNGLNWISVAQGVDNNGRYLWTIPDGANSTQCLVRIAPSAAAPDLRIVPSALFTLHPITLGQAVNAYWPTLNKDRFHRGFSDVAGPRTGCVKWEYSTSSPVYGSAVIGDANNIYIASGNRLVKLSPNGSEQWSYMGPDEFLSSPAIGLDGAIHIGSQNGCLYSIDINGNLRWTHQTNAAIYATPTVAPNGSIYVGSMDGTLYALAPDGSCLWQFTPDNKGMILSSPTIGQNGEVYVGFLYNPQLYALDGQTGSILWSRHFGWNWSEQLPQYGEISGSLFTSPVIGNDGKIYIATLNDSIFYALNPGDGSTAWSLPLNQVYPNRGYANNIQGMSDGWSEPVIGVDGTIYVCMDDMYVWAIRPGGTVAWIRQLGLSGAFTLATSANGLIYAACDEGLIYVLDSNGSLVSYFKGDQRLSHPVLSPDGMLYIGDSSGKLWAIGSGDCQIGDHLLYPAGDQNQDIQVNMSDFEIISNNWLTDTSSQQWVFEESDLNRDCLTNLEDVMIFCNNWLYSE